MGGIDDRRRRFRKGRLKSEREDKKQLNSQWNRQGKVMQLKKKKKGENIKEKAKRIN